MDIAVAGAHGQVARLLTRQLVARGDTVRGLIRNPAHAGDVRADGGEPSVCDLESVSVAELGIAIERSDAVAFAAGAGPGSGPERKLTLDRDGATKLVEAALSAHVPAYVMLSAIGAEDPPQGDDDMSVYRRAKAEADRVLMDSALRWTIVRPGRLTDAPGTGRVHVARHVDRADVPREDVAATLTALIHDVEATGRILSLVGGEDPIVGALTAALRADPRDQFLQGL